MINCQSKRFIVALLITALICLGVPTINTILSASNALAQTTSSETNQTYGSSKSDQSSLANSASVFLLFSENMELSEIDPSVASFSNSVSKDFRKELVDTLTFENITNVVANEDCSVVGFTSPNSSEEVFDSVTTALCSNGWAKIQSEYENVACFTKESGAFTWALVSCTTIGNITSVVIQSA